MSRHGYAYDLDPLDLGRYRAQVASAIRGKRGQAFLRELAAIMDATPESERVLIRGKLIDEQGCCCTIGLVCKSRGVDVAGINVEEPEEVAKAVGIARQMAAEIEYENDDMWDVGFDGDSDAAKRRRWQYMREWVERQLKKGGAS